MQSFTRWLVVAAGLTLAVSALAAGDPNEKAIKARKAVMTLQSWYAGPLFQMAKGDMDYDADTAGAYAAALDTMASIKGDHDVASGNRQRRVRREDTGAPRALVDLAGGGREGPGALPRRPRRCPRWRATGSDALRSKIGAVGKACKGCHDDFRAEQVAVDRHGGGRFGTAACLSP